MIASVSKCSVHETKHSTTWDWVKTSCNLHSLGDWENDSKPRVIDSVCPTESQDCHNYLEMFLVFCDTQTPIHPIRIAAT